MDRMESDRIAKRVYVGVCAGGRLVGRPRKRWNDNMECLRKRVLDVRHGVCEGKCMGRSPGD